MKKFIFLLVAIVSIPILLFVLNKVTSPTLVFLVPSDYRGWVRVNYDVPEAPKLENDFFTYTVRVDSDGVVPTSSDLSNTSCSVEIYFVDTTGKRIEIQPNPPEKIDPNQVYSFGFVTGAFGDGGNKDQGYHEFFIGTEKEYHKGVEEKERKEFEGWSP